VDGTRNSHTKGSKSERERQIPYDITYIWNHFSTEKKIMNLENRLVVVKGEGERVGWTGNFVNCTPTFPGTISVTHQSNQSGLGNCIRHMFYWTWRKT